jgi:hypothetical protein
VATSRPSNLANEPKLKRLRSVVSTSTGDSLLVDHPQRIQSIARVPNPMATVIKAVAEAAEDVIKVKSSGSVFDRLGRGMDVSETSGRHHAEFREAAVEDGEYGDNNRIQPQTWSSYHKKSDYNGQYVGNMTMLESETGLASDSTSDNEGYDDVNIMGRRVMDVSETGTSAGNKGEDSLMVQYSVAQKADDVMRRNKDHDQAVAAANSSRSKIVNISVNVNTWKPPHYQEPREIVEADNRKSILESDAGSDKSGVRLMTEPAKVGNGNVRVRVHKYTSSCMHTLFKNLKSNVCVCCLCLQFVFLLSLYWVPNCELVLLDVKQAKPAADAQKESQKTLSSTPGEW